MSLCILALEPRPLARLSARAVSHGGGAHEREFPVLLGRARGLPAELEGLLLASDLEGRGPQGESGAELLASWLLQAGGEGRMPAAGSLGVCLAGDLYVDPELRVRGLAGEVGAAWEAFAGFRWVLGVAGNHDRFARPPAGLLDGTVQARDGLRVAGVGGVAAPGDPRPFHREPADQAARLEAALAGAPDLLLLHEGPRLPRKRFPGSAAVAEALAGRPGTLVVCGHKHWDRALGELPGGPQVLNVDGRAVLLVEERWRRRGRRRLGGAAQDPVDW